MGSKELTLHTYFLKLSRKYNLNMKKLSRKKGQHFLIDENTIKREIQIADVHTGDIVLEIGAGLGFLTRYLLKKAKKVIAIELDKTFFKILTSEFSHIDSLTLIQGDILKLPELPEFTKIVSNIPYCITSPLFEKMTSWNFHSATLIIQHDVAKRLVANPKTKEYGKLTIFMKTNFEISLFDIVPPESFYPPPKVTSQIIQLIPLTTKFIWTPLAKSILAALFNRKHKKVKHNLKVFYNQQKLSSPIIQKIKNQISEYLERRSIELSIEEVLYIINTLVKTVMADMNE